MIETVGNPLLWTGFLIFVLAMLAVDLRVHREAHVIGAREALSWSVFWIGLACLFGVGVWVRFGATAGLEYFAGYLIEKSLSVDNVFVFAVLFSSFGVPPQHQHRILFWGILGALVMRAVFIFAGAVALAKFHWVAYVFGGVLIVTGIRLLRRTGEDIHPEANPVFRLFQKIVPSVAEYHGGAFMIVRGGRRFATPLLTVLVAVEITDLIFAVDSIPAIFAVTRDPFIVFTSNIFAILGLRALYFLLAGAIRNLAYLHVGLALVLVFVGGKMLLVDVYRISTPISLAVVTVLITGAVLWSLAVRPAPPDGGGSSRG